MKKFAIIFVALACICASGVVCLAMARGISNSAADTPLVTKTVEVGFFDEIEASRVDIELTYGRGDGTARLTAPSGLIDDVKIVNHEGKLIVCMDKKLKNLNEIQCKLELCGDVREISASLAAQVDIDRVEAREIEISTRTAANVRVGDISTTKLDIESATASTVVIDKIRSERSDMEANTAASIKIGKGTLGRVDIEANTASKLTIKADIAGGKVESNTGAEVRCPKSKISTETSTGGSVKTF